LDQLVDPEMLRAQHVVDAVLQIRVLTTNGRCRWPRCPATTPGARRITSLIAISPCEERGDLFLVDRIGDAPNPGGFDCVLVSCPTT